MEKRKRVVIALVALHTVLLAFYTFPTALVPEKLRVIGQFYARPVFHQQWRLFAPDPPLCSCNVQANWSEDLWVDIDHGPDTYLQRRTVQAVARHMQAEVHRGDTIPAEELVRAAEAMVYNGQFDPGRGRELPELRLRLVEHCVVDPWKPRERAERITYLRTR